MLFALLLATAAHAQPQNQPIRKDTVSALSMALRADAKPTIELNPTSALKKKREEEKKKQKKRKKNVFYAAKSKKRIIRTVNGKVKSYEKFYVQRSYVAPEKYAFDKFYFDKQRRQIVRKRYSSPEYGMALHGTYERVVDGKLRERGIFYNGVKHGRWESYDKSGTITLKEYFNKGFPKEAEITTYPNDTRIVKEIKPIQHGKLHGVYMSFFENGNLQEIGMYYEGIKIGTWTEYYNKIQVNGLQRKHRETRHRDRVDAYDFSIAPIVTREWNEKGIQTISVDMKGVVRNRNEGDTDDYQDDEDEDNDSDEEEVEEETVEVAGRAKRRP